ncbi:unnamed protein product [Phyllotreta striolata]|uniref:G-protein coupled receptors family 1 profile domain-containing protein n=1 Tax=Phyllotreta striolata TaxID=444603 RepID=A0A9P0DQ80_PHYSR|nr:unnamed protein product [Phyllotreta striolata]
MTETTSVLENVTIIARRSYGVEEEMLMPAGGYVAAAVVLFFIGFFGFFLNLSVIVLMLKDTQLWTPLNIILFNLICSDFSVSILGNPWTLISAVSYKWIFGAVMCQIYAFFMSLLGITSITTLTVLAFERYLIVSRPFRNHSLSRKDAVYLVIGIWIYSLLLTIPPLIGWGKFVPEAANIRHVNIFIFFALSNPELLIYCFSCSVNWEEHSYNAMTYIMYIFAFGLVLPLGVISFSYFHIIHQMKKNNMTVGQTSKAERRVTLMVLLMIVSYLFAWSPYAVCALIEQFGEPSTISPAVGVLPALLAKSSICYNPIIYVGLNSQFRQVLKQYWQFKDRTQESNCETYAMGVSNYVSTTYVDTAKFGKLTPTKAAKAQMFVFRKDKCKVALAENKGRNMSCNSQV